MSLTDLSIWDSNAFVWDAAMGSQGNFFYRHLVLPSCLKLLSLETLEKPIHILELACGNGIFSKHLASLSPHFRILATDFSQKLLDICDSRWKGAGFGDRIKLMKVDVTNEEDFKTLSAKMKDWYGSEWKGFDRVVCNMSIMDIENIDVLAKQLPKLLADKGSFTATVVHPAFNSASNTVRVAETGEGPDGRVTTNYAIKTTNYLDVKTIQGEAILGQPSLQNYYHRPIHVLFTTFFKEGLCLDGIEEPSFLNVSDEEKTNVADVSHCIHYKNIPLVIAFRLRKFTGNP